jgi:hypothetical protein
MSGLEPLLEAFRLVGEDPSQVLTEHNAYLVAYGHEVLGLNSVPGVILIPQRTERGIHARVTVLEGRRIEQPVHLCFGLFERFGVQNVELDLTVGPGSRATFWSHCLFTAPEVARHAMTASVRVATGAELTYHEAHYHGVSGGLEVRARAAVTVERGARYLADFALVQGRVGKLDIDYEVAVGEDALAELTSRVYGHGSDSIRICEALSLDGPRSRGLVKSRVAVEDEASAEVVGETTGNAEGARGHVDCLEVVRGAARASAVPKVAVTHPGAQVTHEAAIGRVDARQLETLMARGLSPDEAADVIVRGMLA